MLIRHAVCAVALGRVKPNPVSCANTQSALTARACIRHVDLTNRGWSNLCI